MAKIIERLQCDQLSGVTILGVGSDPVIYAGHMRQIIGTQWGTTQQNITLFCKCIYAYIPEKPCRQINATWW